MPSLGRAGASSAIQNYPILQQAISYLSLHSVVVSKISIIRVISGYTATGINRLQADPVRITFGRVSRNFLKNHIVGMYHRLYNPADVTFLFIRDCISDPEDSKEQQISQSMPGDKARASKIADLCFFGAHSSSTHAILCD